MPANLVPVDTWPANFQVAADGDAVSQATRTNVMQEYADAHTYLRNRSPAAVAGNYQIPIAPTNQPAAGWVQRWAWDIAGPNGWTNISVAGVDEIQIPLPALKDCSFSSVSMVLHGDGAGAGPHVGAVGTMPLLSLYKIDGAGAAGTTLVGSQIDTTVAPATYDVLHTVTYTPGAPQTIDETTQYALSIRGEAGANSIANALILFGLYMTIVPT